MGRRAPEHRSAQWLGQHFLKSPKLAASLVRQTSVSSSDLIVEVGAGDGMLTKELARCAARVIAVEVDPMLATALIKRFSNNEKVLVVAGDFFELPSPGRRFRVFGNIPFDKTTRLLRHLLDSARDPMFRADLVVQRGAAIKRTQRWNLLNLCWAPWWEFATTARIPSRAFKPPPSVDAALLTISKRKAPLLPERDAPAFVRFARVAWPATDVRTAMNRHVPGGYLRKLSMQLRFSLSASPGQLDVHQWIALYRAQSK